MMIIQNQEKTFEQKVQEAKQISFQESQVDLTKPYMKNMNEDPLLNARISYSLANEYTYVGRQTGNPVPQIIINVGGIQENHAVFHYTEDRIFLKPMNKLSSENLFLNGDQVKEETEVLHNDRIAFGNHSIFIL